ncbi:DEAD/DEAH box helicase family protein [candidate division WOR-3 bacterium]|nr:DEAD/DEAH box helicase family protein [candidate division WOR-3 bacterium]
MEISVGELVNFVFCDNDLESNFKSMEKTRVGGEIHRERQASMSESGDYESEKYLKLDFVYEGREFTIKGKADGLLTEDGITTVEEIKTGEMSGRGDYEIQKHLAQAKCYAFMYSKIYGESNISVKLVYIDEERKIEQKKFLFSHSELENDFFEMFEKYFKWLLFLEKRRNERDKSLSEVSFPHDTFRKGQEEMFFAVFEAVENSKTLFVRAPTGIGKTAATIFPSLKSLGADHAEKVFYLTAKTTTREVAQNTLRLFSQKGMSLKSVSITAKSKICFLGLDVCDVDHCPYAKGYYGRVKTAIVEALMNEDLLTSEEIEKYAKIHGICPFEFSLDISRHCDFIVCDYNYLFDPNVFLRRYFLEDSGDFVFLIDEAHNLPDRARDMYSAQLKRSMFSEKKYLLSDYLAEDSFEEVENFFELILSKIPEEGFWIQSKPLDEIIPVLQSFSEWMAFWMKENYGKKHYNEILKLYFDVQTYLKIFDLYGSNYVTYIKAVGNDVVIKQFCLDPSRNLRKVLKKGRSSIFFSATMKPMEYYRDILGGDANSLELELESPFPEENLSLCLTPYISTKYSSRNFSLSEVCSVIHETFMSKKGNYMAYFPSYAYLEKAIESFRLEYPDVKIACQSSMMTEKQRQSFLNKFSKSRKEGLLGFAVMGGVFSEGIDLHGDRLSGAVIVGVGLPKICFELEIVREYFEREREAGFDFAYTYPGMNKVLQAAGRVIRTENDKGVIVLIDARFSSDKYLSLFPKEWSNYKVVSSEKELRTVLKRFWQGE